jgi:hypothetical protein
MGKATAKVTIQKPADEVWGTIGRFGDLRWYMGVARCRVENGVRFTTLDGAGRETNEREFHHDDAARTYSYGVIGFSGDTIHHLPNGETFDLRAISGHHRATLTVTPAGASTSLLTYDLELDDELGNLLPTMIRRYQSIIDHLKSQLEA